MAVSRFKECVCMCNNNVSPCATVWILDCINCYSMFHYDFATNYICHIIVTVCATMYVRCYLYIHACL